ncbi:MAG TPA: nitroreductase family deazaflavin-dependent oxidoreductase [Acidimicrobiia bacterium]
MTELPPRGTYGATIPKPVRWMMKSMGWSAKLMVRFGMKIQGQPLVLLTTVGARTGKRRETVLSWFDEGESNDSGYVVASNAGSASHPGWAHNLANNPDEVSLDRGDGETAVDAQMLSGGERRAVWDEVVELAPGYGRYLEKTDREIPIFRLSLRK